jgi:hypothetical protein
MLEPKDRMNDFFEPEKGARPGVTFIPLHQRCPLSITHRTGAGVGKQIDKDILRAQSKKIVARTLDRRLAIRSLQTPDLLYNLDPKGLGGI